MFCLCQNKRIPALCFILIGLGIILLIPKLASADSQPALYSIDIQAHTEFSCGHCYSLGEEQTPSSALITAPALPDPCDLCHTDIVESLPEDVARANQVEEDLFTASAQAIQLQNNNLSDRQKATVETATDLITQAQNQLDAGNIDEAEALLAQANNLLADIADEHHLANPLSPLFMPIGLVASSTQKHNDSVYTQYSLNDGCAVVDGQLWTVYRLESHLFNQLSAEAMHRRAPPVDEDALILANTINLLT